DGVAYRVTVGIGIAGIDADAGDAQAVLRCADEVCYCAKKQGGDRVVVCGQDAFSDSVAVLHERADLDIAQRLTQERNYLLYSQPIYRADSASAVPQRCEILLRIQDRKGGVITPDQFLPIAHRHGLEIGLDQWVVANTAAAWAARRTTGDNTPLECFVNLSRASIEAAAATADYVAGVLEKWRIPPGVLCLELKERDVLDCRQDASHLIRQLHRRGVHFALDAVGEGLYSLGYLKNLPVDYIKVSAGATLQAEGDAFYGAFLDALANVSRSLGIALVGVGAESEHILDRFGAYQMAYLQGHALSLPAPFPMAPPHLQGVPGMEPH
ncbi:MAG: GGDEF domain-containing phosphodiesterase, partial [Thiohalobacteraceae bacterium]